MKEKFESRFTFDTFKLFHSEKVCTFANSDFGFFLKTITQNKERYFSKIVQIVLTAQAAKTAKTISMFSNVANIDQLSMKLGILL